MKIKYSLIILFVFSLLNITALRYAIADEYYSITTNSWIEQSNGENAQVLQQIEDLKKRKALSSSGHVMNGSFSLANSSQSVAKTTQSNKLQQKEQLRIARKNALIKTLESRPVRKNLIIVNKTQDK